jgi:ABC-type phosphate transport system substrate-binding protein
MRNKAYKALRKLPQIIAGACLFAASPAVLAQDAGAGNPDAIAIVVHKDLPVESLTLEELRSIFLADRQFWENRTRITLLVRAPQSDERSFVLDRIYQMSEAQFRQYWIAKMFRAEVPRGPKIVLSSGMALDLVVAIPGSISFTRADAVTNDVKVIRIDGLLPNDAGYPLK